MLWFIQPAVVADARQETFKYILCYGSSGQSEPTGYGSLFKYILCYGSSKARRENLAMAQNLNTSYVMVHLGSGLRL